MSETDYAQQCITCHEGIVFDPSSGLWIAARGTIAVDMRAICDSSVIDRRHIPAKRNRVELFIDRRRRHG